MRPKPLPADALQGATFHTPTGLAEEAYLAEKLKQHRPIPIGPAGLPIPSKMGIFQPTAQKGLLPKLCHAAWRAHCDEVLPAEAHDAARAAVVRELERRFPPADMDVLDRYKATGQAQVVFVHLLAARPIDPLRITLAAPVRVPKTVEAGFHIDLGGNQRTTVPPAPADLEAYGRARVELVRAEAEFRRATQWVADFHLHKARWPKWAEIEAANPAVGEWIAKQREAMSSTPQSARAEREI